MKIRPSKACRGFTLIELMVVVAILGVLASLVTIGAQKALGKAHTIKCASNLHQIGLAFSLYLQEHDNVMPQRVYPNKVDGLEFGYDELLLTYTGENREIFKCPEHHGLNFPTQPSYGMNWYFDNMHVGRIQAPETTILVADVMGDDDMGSHRADRDSGSPGQLAETRHDGKANYLFFDGHVELLEYDETVDPVDMWGTDGERHDEGNP